MRLSSTLSCFLAIAALSIPLAAQELPYAPGQVVVLAEPGVLQIPPGLDHAPMDRVGVAQARLRAVFAKHRVSAVGRAVSAWPPAGGASERKIQARRKGGLMPPDALADLSLLYVLELPAGSDVPAAVRDLNETAGIVYAEPSYRSYPVAPLHPNDPLYTSGLNWGFYNASNPSYDVNAPDAWAIQTGLDSIRISIHDTGIERTHPDFNGGGKVAGEYDFVNGDADAYPDLSYTAPYHGTAVAGIAGAQTNNGLHSAGLCGGFGANQGCRILAAKVLGNNSYGNIHADATTWSINNGAKVINNSWCSSSVSRATHDAFRNAYLSGVVVTAAMGNTEPDKCGQSTADTAVAPASFSDVLMAVGATNQNGQRITRALGYSWESGIGPHVSVVAPGVDHYSLALSGSTTYFAGTSEATPFVSGLAGLLFSESQAKGLQLTPTDVRQIIQGTATDLLAAGWDSETGYGLIDAGKALQVLQSPNQLTFASVGPATAACYSQVGPTNWTFWSSWVVKLARRCEVRRNVTFAKQYVSAPLAWGRPVSGGGVTPSNPNSEVYWTGVVPGTVTATGATLRTYAYEIWSLTGTFEGWYPAQPSQLSFAYAVLGQPVPPPPFTVTADAPGFVSVKATYSLTGSASDAASGWRWDRSDDGGPYSLWANAQNSQFIAYAGNYTIGWRLFAQRNSDGATSYGYASTQVCIPMSSSCLALHAPASAGPPADTAGPPLAAPRLSIVRKKAPGDRHFGSGIWIGLPNEKEAIRFYSLAGDHAAGGDWPNLLDRESVAWSAPAAGLRPGAWIESHRTLTAPGVSLYTVRGGLTGDLPSEISLGLVADPDLGSRASDDTLGFDEETGLAWAGDRGPAWIGYLAIGAQARRGARLRQFGIQGSPDPDTAARAFEAMAAPSLLDGRPSDVRFLLTLPKVPVREDGSFAASFAVLEAASLAELRELAAAIREVERDPAAAGPAIQ